MCARCLPISFFSFLRISNLVPYTLADLVSDKSYFLKRSDVSFSATGAILRVYRTKTIQFNQRALEIRLPLIPNSVLCPVSALQTLLSIVPAPTSKPPFIIPTGNGIKLAHHFNRFLKSCARATGFNGHCKKRETGTSHLNLTAKKTKRLSR